MRFATLIVCLGLASCAINVRKGPNAPSESKTSSSQNQTSDSNVSVTVGNAARGAQLYSRHCEDCHNPLATTTKRKATIADIQRGILNVPEMEDLDRRLKLSDIASIVEALK